MTGYTINVCKQCKRPYCTSGLTDELVAQNMETLVGTATELLHEKEDLERAVDHLTDMLWQTQGEEKRLRKHRDKYAGIVRKARAHVTLMRKRHDNVYSAPEVVRAYMEQGIRDTEAALSRAKKDSE